VKICNIQLPRLVAGFVFIFVLLSSATAQQNAQQNTQQTAPQAPQPTPQSTPQPTPQSVPQPGVQPVGQAAALLPMPDYPTMVRHIWSHLVALQQANISGNYQVFHQLGAPGFQQANPPKRLVGIFPNCAAKRLT
jgi:hypothetical protein